MKFYSRQNEDCSPGGSTSLGSERLFQRGSGRRSVCKILVEEFNTIKCLLYKSFPLVRRSGCHHEGIQFFLDMRRRKVWDHKICSWKYTTIWRPVLPGSLEQRVPLSTLISLRGCWRSAAAAAQSSVSTEFSSVIQSGPTPCDAMDCSTNIVTLLI